MKKSPVVMAFRSQQVRLRRTKGAQTIYNSPSVWIRNGDRANERGKIDHEKKVIVRHDVGNGPHM